MNSGSPTPIGILTVSDRVFQQQYTDKGGPAVRQWLQERLSPAIRFEMVTVPDDLDPICQALRSLASSCGLVITTGGTGISPRDVTPEAMQVVCQRFLPGFGEKMRAANWDRVPTTILSRATAGQLDRSLVLNLPGNPRAVAECLEAVWPVIPHAVELLGNSLGETRDAASTPHSDGDSARK